ncbi:uncharacterized protein LOC106651981 [Trichogramma pretiosum]|uniref:uncharacterized protein LOC106651981 n=1 Tax=Trichogramma pretiosum TaxID=7493 RepID=UPI0006C94975|nr:uncharacterized protein LOC106651981 [Trichogramma pretiosum]
MYLKNCAVISLVLIVLLFVNSVNSLKCYTCLSPKSGECWTNPVQDKYISDCDGENSFEPLVGNMTMIGGVMIIEKASSGITTISNHAKKRWTCIKTIQYDRKVGMKVERSCAARNEPCQFSRFSRCFRCKSQLCNSAESPTLTLGMLALLGVVGVYSTM